MSRKKKVPAPPPPLTQYMKNMKHMQNMKNIESRYKRIFSKQNFNNEYERIFGNTHVINNTKNNEKTRIEHPKPLTKNEQNMNNLIKEFSALSDGNTFVNNKNNIVGLNDFTLPEEKLNLIEPPRQNIINLENRFRRLVNGNTKLYEEVETCMQDKERLAIQTQTLNMCNLKLRKCEIYKDALEAQNDINTIKISKLISENQNLKNIIDSFNSTRYSTPIIAPIIDPIIDPINKNNHETIIENKIELYKTTFQDLKDTAKSYIDLTNKFNDLVDAYNEYRDKKRVTYEEKKYNNQSNVILDNNKLNSLQNSHLKQIGKTTKQDDFLIKTVNEKVKIQKKQLEKLKEKFNLLLTKYNIMTQYMSNVPRFNQVQGGKQTRCKRTRRPKRNKTKRK
jgi:hypothetical protein